MAMLALASPAAGQAAPAFATTAPIAYMVDLGSGRVLFARDPHRRFPPASMTKIMTAYVIFEQLASGRLRPRQRVVVGAEAARRWAGVGTSLNLEAGRQVTIDILLDGLMTVSANDAAVVLAEGASGSVTSFAALMNRQARTLGLSNSRFANPNGWPDRRATYTSAADLATLTRAMIARHPQLYRRYIGRREMAWNGVVQASRNPLLGAVAGADGVKTGFTSESGYGLVGSAVQAGRRLVMVVAGCRSERERQEESRRLIAWGYQAWDSRRLFAAGAEVAGAKVQAGESRRVPLIAPQAYFLTLARGEPDAYRLRVRYLGPLRAPVRRGQQVAELIVTAAGQERRLPLVAGEAVAAAGWWARLRNGVLGLLGR